MGLRHLSHAELTEYADGETDPKRLAPVEARLGRCHRCARSLALIREAARLVSALPIATAPAGLRARSADAFLEQAGAPISCDQAAPLMQEHLDGCLSPAGALLLSRHVQSCPPCSVELDALASTSRLLRSLPSPESPAWVRASVREAATRVPRRAPFALQWKPALAVACAVTVLGAMLLLRPVATPVPQPTVAESGEERSDVVSGSLEVAFRGAASDESEPEPAALGATAGDDEAVGGEEEPTPAAEHRTPAPVARTVAHMVKGPAPALVAPEAPAPEVAMPSGLMALRVVARSAAYDVEVQRAMELAAVQFATLHSEALSEATPGRLSPLGEPGSEAGEGGEGEATLDPGVGDSVEEGTTPQPTSGAGPAPEGANLMIAPLV